MKDTMRENDHYETSNNYMKGMIQRTVEHGCLLKLREFTEKSMRT